MRIHFADFVVLYPQRVETRVASTHFRNGLKPRYIPPFPQRVETPCSQIGHGYAIRAWIRSNRFGRFDR